MILQKTDEYYMNLALEQAVKGKGRTSPNPCVGAIIVKDDVIVGRGYHKKAGTPHAEVHALADAGEESKGATIYVTLEPCSHTGRTPPCCEAVHKAGVTRVVVGMMDPNPLVDGKGVQYLRAHGVEVVTGICQEECVSINLPFIKRVKKGLPWMIMKGGISLDGKLNYQKGQSGWITGAECKQKVHDIRNQVDAILVGSATVMIDNPSLTTRLVEGDCRNPARIILDSDLKTDITSKVYDSGVAGAVYLFCDNEADDTKKERFKSHGIHVVSVAKMDGKLDLLEIMHVLAEKEICSVLVEGGASVHGEMLRRHLFDAACLFYAPIFAGTGGVSLVEGYSVAGRAEAVRLQDVRYHQLGADMMIEGLF